jgi:hypothetical protein
MATFRLSHFSSPEVIKAIDRRRLVAFLDPHRAFFKTRGIDLPAVASDGEPDYDALVRVFMSPDESTPKDLIDALYYVDGMSTAKGMEDLIDAAREARLTLDAADDVTPADLAVQVWLRDPELLERKQAEQYLLNPKSFEHYLTDDPDAGSFQTPDADTLRRLEAVLNDWFEQRKRGRTARVFVFPRDDAVWFMVRHGEPYKREGSVVGVEPSSVAYRPLKYDVLVYTPALRELRINAQLKGERQLYRTEFGRHFFGSQNYFNDGVKYTLEPLRDAGEPALVCADVAGMEWVRLKELHYNWGGAHGEYEIAKANDLFAALKDRGGRSIPKTPALAKAVFLVKFVSAKRARTVTVKPPNTALYARDEDSDLVEEWLKKRGFLNVYVDADDQTLDPLLASA